MDLFDDFVIGNLYLINYLGDTIIAEYKHAWEDGNGVVGDEVTFVDIWREDGRPLAYFNLSLADYEIEVIKDLRKTEDRFDPCYDVGKLKHEFPEYFI